MKTDTPGWPRYLSRMPHFHLHVYDTFAALDKEGVDLPNLNAAYADAIAGMRSIISARVLDGQLPTDLRIGIADGVGTELAVVTFKDAIDVPLEFKPAPAPLTEQARSLPFDALPSHRGYPMARLTTAPPTP